MKENEKKVREAITANVSNHSGFLEDLSCWDRSISVKYLRRIFLDRLSTIVSGWLVVYCSSVNVKLSIVACLS